jgi:hypothetical protein
MAGLKQAARADMRGWEQAPRPQPDSAAKPPVPGLDNTPGRQPNMLSAMPLNAATGDAFQRQFYGGTSIPTYRILPAGKVSA